MAEAATHAPEDDLSIRAMAILAQYFLAPGSSIVIANIDRILTEENARAMDEMIRRGLLRREIAEERGENAVRYVLTERGAMVPRLRDVAWLEAHGAFRLTETLFPEDPEPEAAGHP